MPIDNNPRRADSVADKLSRRHMLALSSTAITMGLAGCSGEDPQNSSGDLKDDTIDSWIERLPTRMTWNPWSTTYPWTTSWVVCEPLVRSFANGDVKLNVLKDWSYDKDEQATTIKFEKGWTWWNGEPVTAADKYYFEELNRLFDPDGSDLKRLEMPDKYTLKRYHKEPQNPDLLVYDVGGWLGDQIRGYRETYKPWVERLQDVSQQSERNKLQEELGNDVKIPTQQVIDEGLGTGPFKLVKADAREMVFEKFEEHPHADNINIPNLRLLVAKDQAIAQRVKKGKLDFGFGTIEERVGGEGVAPDSFENVGKYRATYLEKVEFGMIGDAAEHVRKREVRQAIACAIDIENVLTNTSEDGYPLEHQSGLPPAIAKEWIGEDQLNKYIQYPKKSDTERASRYMEQAGYSKDGDKWVDPSGETITLEFPISSPNTTKGKTVSDQLKEFGFEVNFMSMEATNLSAKYSETPTYDITLSSHGDLSPHPYNYFRTHHQFGNELGENGAVQRWLDDGKERSEFIGRELTPEIPTEVGAEDLSGETEEINLFELNQQWKSAQTTKENREIARKFSWYWNFHLPQIDIYQQGGASWGNTEKFEFKNQDSNDWAAYRAYMWNLKQGNIAARPK